MFFNEKQEKLHRYRSHNELQDLEREIERNKSFFQVRSKNN